MIKTDISLEYSKTCAGMELAPSDWLLIGRERIDSFADASNDHQFILVDTERAATTSFGSTIAQGFLTFLMLSYLVSLRLLFPKVLSLYLVKGKS